jgi:hypothetical protein
MPVTRSTNGSLRPPVPGGHALLAFQVGDERVRPELAYGYGVISRLSAD